MPTGIELAVTPRAASTVVTVSGHLDLAGYAVIRDGLLKIAAEAPPGMIADITGLGIGEASPATVFPFVAARIRDWPGIPLALVTRRPEHTRLFRRYATDRYVPVHPDVDAAERALSRPIRCQARRLIPRTEDASSLAREFVRQFSTQWGIPELIYDGTMIAGELADNAIRHTTSIPELRLDLRRGILTIAVVDDSPRPAMLIERPGLRGPGLGLRIVAYAAHTWGSSRHWSGGKTVWAVLTYSGEIQALPSGPSVHPEPH